MAIVTGKDSKVMNGANQIGYVTSISFTPQAEMNKITALGEAAQKVIPGTQSFSGSVTCKLDTNNATGKQIDLVNAFLGGSALTFQIYTDATHYWTGNGYIKSMPHKIAGGKTVTEVEFQFESDGDWIYYSPP